MLVIGIDPGKTGAIVALSDMGNVIWKYVTPTIGKEIDWDKFASFLRYDDTDGVHVILEHVHAMFGVAASTTFTFGGCFEGVKALIAAYRLPFTLVQPKVWQKVMWQGIQEHRKPPKKLTKKELIIKAAGSKVRTPKAIGSIDTKMMSLIAAKRLFPNEDLRASTHPRAVPHNGIVDALLLAEYGRRLLCK